MDLIKKLLFDTKNLSSLIPRLRIPDDLAKDLPPCIVQHAEHLK